MAKRFVCLDADEDFNVGMLEALIREARANGADGMAQVYFNKKTAKRPAKTPLVGKLFVEWEDAE